MIKNFVIPEEIVFKQKTRMSFTICSSLGILVFLFMFFHAGQNILILIGEALAGRKIVHEIWIERIRIFSMFGITWSFIIFIITVIKKKINRYELLIFIFLIIQLLSINTRNREILAFVSYLQSYKYGFASRMFIGTIVDLLAGGGFISKEFVYVFTFCGTLFLCFYISVILGHIIQKSENHLPLLLLTILYFSSSISPAAYFVEENFGRMEKYIFLFILVIFSVVDKRIWRWFIPALCFMSLATHLVSIFLYMPLVIIILLYKVINKDNQSKSELFLFILTTAIITLSFLYFVIFSRSALVFQTEQEFANALKYKTDIKNPASWVHYDYFLSIIDTFRFAANYFVPVTALIKKFYCILQNLPLFVFFVLFWKNCITLEREKSMKMIFLLSMFLPLVSIPAFMLFIDWGRWVIMLLTVQFMLVFYFLHTQAAAVVHTANKFTTIVQKNMFAAVLFIMLSVFFDQLLCINSSGNFTNLLYYPFWIIEKILKIAGVN
jgi:hypothetical protein